MRTLNVFGLAACAFLAVASVGSSAEAKEAEGWKLSGGSGSQITSGTGYNLYNIDQKSFLDYKDRWGANLGWHGTAENNIEIKVKGGGALTCGALFAMKVDNEWLKYGHQNVGINITSTKTFGDDLYQWKIVKCTAGQPVAKDTAIAIMNTKENDSLVGCKRPAGVNLAWANDVTSKAGYCVRTKPSL